MEITITKGVREDRMAIRRANGSQASFAFPKKGTTVHDAIHFFVERELGFRRGFWGLVAAGYAPDDVGALAREHGHASASRASQPDAEIVELLQAERLVECFEAEAWSGSTDDEGLLAMAHAGWTASHVRPVAITDAQLLAIRTGLAAFHADWAGCATGGALRLVWEMED